MTLFDFKSERLSIGAQNWILERIEWKELSFAFDHQLYCVASFCVLIDRKYHVHHLGKISNTSVGSVRYVGYIFENQKCESFSLEAHWVGILMFQARPISDAAQSESLVISVLSLGLHHLGWYHYGPDSWAYREFD